MTGNVAVLVFGAVIAAILGALTAWLIVNVLKDSVHRPFRLTVAFLLTIVTIGAIVAGIITSDSDFITVAATGVGALASVVTMGLAGGNDDEDA